MIASILKSMRLFVLLNEPSQEISVNEMENAYLDFVEQIKLINASKDYSYAFRTLNFVRIELQERIWAEQMYFQKSLSFIKSELELLEKQMMYPKLFIQKDDGFTSDLYLDTNEVSYVDIMEIIVGFFYLAGIKTSDGKAVSLSRLTNRFEHFLNFQISNAYKKEEEVLQRLPIKRTGFLDKLKSLIHKKSSDKGYKS